MFSLIVVVLGINRLIIRFLTKAVHYKTKDKYVKSDIILAKPNYGVGTPNKDAPTRLFKAIYSMPSRKISF